MIRSFVRRAIQAFLSNQERLSPLESWYLAALNYQMKRARRGTSPFGNYYEFGVGWGDTMCKYLRALQVYCRNKSLPIEKFRIFGFDSFKGLPTPNNWRDDFKTWHEGDFAFKEEQVLARVRSVIQGAKPSIRFIGGFFQDSLTPSLREELANSPPAIVTIDVDYYSSAKAVLEWLRPILPSGSLFYFDDIWSFHGNPEYGELAAINEFNAKNDGFLTPFPMLGMNGLAYVYARKKFEYTESSGTGSAET
jgi:hypothetical protein